MSSENRPEVASLHSPAASPTGDWQPETGRPVPQDDLARALDHIKPQVRELAAYTLKHYQPRIKLNQNESPYDVPAELKRRIQARLADRPWNRYPPFVAKDFISAVSETHGWPMEGVLVANGSNELIQAVLAVVVRPGLSVVIPEPTFTLYRLMTEVGGGDVVSVPLREDLRFDVDAIVAAARASSAAVIVLCTPNNPTGSALSVEEILRVHDSTDALVLLDQAYVEFGGGDAIPLLEGRPRLIVLRTFSKAMALAGLRAGYLLGHPAVVEQVNKAKLPYNINFFTESVAAELLRERALLQPHVDEMRAERDRVFERLSTMRGIRAFPSEANFILFRVEATGLDHDAVFDRLLDDHGVLVRDVSKYPMLAGCLRVNAGTPEENDTFLAGMSAILESTA
ncbi:MAG: histidinol-phosphate transaminase [Gemmatimonadetes bacterium]|nr:histidinol-phosphate transaminase [Gemmatimonadota bacterium]